VLTLSRKYTSIPSLRGDDNVIPPASELPQMLKNLAHPRKRSISLGPQSAADAYETLAYRNRRRRESVNSQDSVILESAEWLPSWDDAKDLKPPTKKKDNVPLGVDLLPSPVSSRLHSYEHMMGTGLPDTANVIPLDSNARFTPDFDSSAVTPMQEENEKRQIFMKLEKPRARYDVEVITKLIVYGGQYLPIVDQTHANFAKGIAWLAVEGNPLLFELCGLGMGLNRM
jgi:hypothetical protein